MDEISQLVAARRIGELEGAAFDVALGVRERAERSQRLSRIALAVDEADLMADDGRATAQRNSPELESRLRDLVHFHDAVVNSSSCRILQRIRGIFGRRW
jgi:hypothetical protein